MKSRIKKIRERMTKAALDCGRKPETIRLVAVSKAVSQDAVQKAIEAGVEILGESYIQEAQGKIAALSEDEASQHVTWHFIGHLQTKKAKYAVKLFDLIHSVDSYKLAQELDKQAKKINKIQAILIQVNIGMELTKSGVTEDEAIALTEDISRLDHVSIKGLMTIPPFYNEPEKARPCFKKLCSVRDRIIKERIPRVGMDELSMGMTGDFEVAIQEGATLVRIGTAIFGERN